MSSCSVLGLVLGIAGNTGLVPYCTHSYPSHSLEHCFKQGRTCPALKRPPWLSCRGWVGAGESGGWKPREAAGLGTVYSAQKGMGLDQGRRPSGQATGMDRLGEELSKKGLRALAWGIVGLLLRWGPRGRTKLGGDAEASLSHTGCKEPQGGVQQALRVETVQKERGWGRRLRYGGHKFRGEDQSWVGG